MFKLRFFALLIMLLLSFALVPAARAANDDFDPDYDFSPDTVGYLGADMNLLLIVRNTGPTDITWVGVGIDTEGHFSKRWSGRIRPGTTRRLSFIVPFSRGDIDETRTMQITMNNDSDAISDGSRTYKFKIRSTNHVFSFHSAISPSGPYRPGDTVTVTMRYRNNITTHGATGATAVASLAKGSEVIYTAPETVLGTIMPESTKTATFSYTFKDSDAGVIDVRYKFGAKMMGRTYNHSGKTLSFEVAAPEPDIDFTASLTAETYRIDAGDNVAFRLTVRNTGEDAIGGFEVRNEDGGLEVSAEGMPAGGSGSVIINKRIYETGDIRFKVKGITGSHSKEIWTDDVDITVREPSSSEETHTAPSASASPERSAEARSSSPSALVTEETPPPSASETTTPVQESAATASPSVSEIPESTPASETIQAAQGQSELIPGVPAWVLLIVIAALLIAIAALIILLALRRKKQGS